MIVFLVTFVLFTIEALLHYNYGHESEKFVLPDIKTFIEMISIVFVFSLLTSYIVKVLHKYFRVK